MIDDSTPIASARLAVPLDALDGVALSSGERVSLTGLVGFERCTVENIAAVVTRAQWTR